MLVSAVASRRPLSTLVPILVSLLSLAAVSVSEAKAASTPSSLVDRERGEEDQIRARLEWFLATRRAGPASVNDLRTLRAAAVRETRTALERQREQRSAGFDAPTNFWSPVGPASSNFGGWAFGRVSGRLTAIAKGADGTLYVAGGAGGVWKSENDGLSWTPLFEEAGTMAVGAIAVDPTAPAVIWVGTGDYNSGCEGYFGIGMLRSTDGGGSWQSRNGAGDALAGASAFSAIVVDPRDGNHVVAGVTRQGCASGAGGAGAIFTTDDGGASWIERLGGVEVHALAQNAQSRDVWWAATTSGIYRSMDNAVSWVKQTASGLPSSGTGRTEVAVAPSDGNVVYAIFADGSGTDPEVWRTTNGGGAWSKMSSGSSACDGQCWYNMTLAVDASDPNTVYRGTVLLFKSTNGGASWTQLINGWGGAQQVHQDIQELLVDPSSPHTFYVGSDGGLWKSEDGGATFLERNANLSLAMFYAIGMHPTAVGTVCGGAQDNSSLARQTSDVWDLQAVTGDGFVCHIDPVDPAYSYITSYPSGGYPNVSRSATGLFGPYTGITGPGSGIVNGDRVNWVTPYLLDPVTPSTLYLGTHRVYKSADHGTYWEPVSGDLTGGSGEVYALEVNRNYPAVVYAGTTSGRVWRSADAGEKWVDITAGLPARSVNDIAADPTNPARAFAVVGGFNTEHLWEWNEGLGWTALGAGLPNVPTNTVLLLESQTVFVGNDVGVFRSLDGGASFAPFMEGLPQGNVVTDLKYVPALNTMTAATYGRGAWQVSLDPVAPILLFDSIELPLMEADGDGDGNVEPGETWQVMPRLRNVGGLAALAVRARLSSLTPGISFEGSDVRAFGDIVGGAVAGSETPYRFVVGPEFPCGSEAVFALREITSTNAPGSYSDIENAFTVTVVNNYEPPIATTRLDDDFDPSPGAGWTHQAIQPGIFGCQLTYKDEWRIATKDAAHQNSYHCGLGPGTAYSRSNYAWLYYGGKDSTGGPGIDLPAEAFAARLTIVHWYDTQAGFDGGQVAIDAVADGIDTYQTIDPVGGYPGVLSATTFCNPLQGKPAFTGNSGGWATTTFDLTEFLGRRIYLAFIFASDTVNSSDEGWYVDRVLVESEVLGAPVCQLTLWPGEVPSTATFVRGGEEVLASWEDSCNAGSPAGQSYSIEVGDLDLLAAGGEYRHAPLGGSCQRTSPTSFTAGDGNEYYLVVANEGGREGSAGRDSNGIPRPQGTTPCGARREGACP